MNDKGSKAEMENEAGSGSEDSKTAGYLPEVSTGSGQAPVEYDPLKRYLWEIGQHALLTREEEYDLAVRLRESDDQDAALRLITSNLRLVVKIAMQFQHFWMRNLQDLIQEGNVGLMQALRKFDPYRGVKFSYYASFWIKAYILKFIMDNWHLVRVGTTQAQRKLFYNLKKEKARLLNLGIDTGPKLLADQLQVTEKDVIEMDQRLSSWEVSLDAPLRDDTEDSHISFLSGNEQPVDDRLADTEIRDLLHEKLSDFRRTLNDRELKILDRRILAEAPETLQDMGAEFGISRERVRQIEERIKAKIRDYLLAELPDLSDGDYLSTLDFQD
ncbi:MAG: RNA polymerase factor sigma-32 [Proteobacteria bacterium]|nr:RNA polymerase factor sigma-32 [Pseudomonadota bacterium]